MSPSGIPSGVLILVFSLFFSLQKLATLCSVALGQPDASLLSRIRILLSENAPIFDAMVQEAALQSLIILVHK